MIRLRTAGSYFMEQLMNNKLIKSLIILPSCCDAEGKFGICSVFDCFMDLAAEHAADLGVGYYDMLNNNCIWVAVRTKVKIFKRAKMGDLITAETWPGKPAHAKSDRFYSIYSENELIAEGRTEWTAQDIVTGAVRRTDSYGWPDIEIRPERVCTEPFTRFKNMIEGETFYYTVGSMDIDTGLHMNNVAYIRMLLGTFSTSEQALFNIKEVEISYRRACKEGEKLIIHRQSEGNQCSFQVEKPNGETAVQAVFQFVSD